MKPTPTRYVHRARNGWFRLTVNPRGLSRWERRQRDLARRRCILSALAPVALVPAFALVLRYCLWSDQAAEWQRMAAAVSLGLVGMWMGLRR